MYVATLAQEGLTDEGKRRRRITDSTGQCPCGARVVIPSGMKPGRFTPITVTHADGCPAVV